ncbi:MAG: RHS repeat domain-containing protein [Ekhidna sp.]|uniref:RHS repeat domain-containing protein n=1 Tax=Ekhidna sp. TaxID=2608089 RepID=UPI0032F028A2
MKNIITLIFLLAYSFSSLSQENYNYVMPSPNSSGMIKALNVPVNLYTGVAAIDVPLYTVEANNGETVPIRLIYVASGIKVSEIASSAGLGWQLIAGGEITRVMRDQPDEQRAFKFTIDQELVNDWFLKGDKTYDTEKDMFYFSFPGGQGRMILDKSLPGSGNCYSINGESLDCSELNFASWPLTSKGITLPLTDYNVEFYKSNKLNSYWIITDTKGNKYYFGSNSSSREITTSNSKLNEGDYDPENDVKYISSWKISKIVYANQPENKSIVFNYKNSFIVDDKVSVQTKLLKSDNGEHYIKFPYYPDVRHFTYRTIIDAKFISDISFPKGSVEFTYKDRQDHNNNLAISSITIKTKEGKQIHSYNFNHSYFNSSDSYYKSGTFGGCYDEKCYRLKLDKIEKNGRLYREFDYKNDKIFAANGADKFELPPRNSYYYDHWGYFNGRANQGETYVPYAENNYPSLIGMNRESRISCTANMLSKMTLTTGSYQTFEYTYNLKNGGACIDAIKLYDDKDDLVTHLNYVYDTDDENERLEVEYISMQSIGDDGPNYEPFAHSHALNLQYNVNGSFGGYSKMKVADEINGSYQIHHFFNDDDYDLSPPQHIEYQFYLQSEDSFNPPYVEAGSHIRYKYEYPFVTHSLDNYLAGLNKQIDIYDESNKLIKSTSFNYSHVYFGDLVKNTVFTWRYEWTDGLYPESWHYLASIYDIQPKFIRLGSQIERFYESGSDLTSEITTTFDYHNTHRTLPKEIVVKRTDGSLDSYNRKSLILYPSDLGSTGLVDQGAVGLPIRQESKINIPQYAEDEYRTTDVSQTSYVKIADSFYPVETKKLFVDDPVSSWTSSDLETISIATYNNQGLLASQTGQDGITTSYTYDDAGYIKTVTTDPGVASLKRTTTYEHFPLIGLKSVTGPDGRKVSYEYDDRNRLLMTRDNEGNILKRYRYNYAGESASFSVYMTPDGGYNQTCSPIKFVVNGTSDLYGETKFTWDFGDQGTANLDKCGIKPIGPQGEEIIIDGTDGNASVVETRNNYVYHNFKEAGTYTVKVSAFNPEIGEEKTYSREITIYALKAGAVVNGPSSVEYCTSTGGGVEQQQYTAPAVPQMDGGTMQTEGGSGGNNYPHVHFSVGFNSTGATCQDYGISDGLLQYRIAGGNWIPFGESGAGRLPDEVFHYSSSPYNVEIQGRVSDNCSSLPQWTPIHTLQIQPCDYNGGIGTGGTGGGIDNPDTPTLPDIDEQQ